MPTPDTTSPRQPYLRDDHTWLHRLDTIVAPGQPAVFLDRDGVIIEERHYLSSPDGVSLIAGAAAAIVRARAKGFSIVIVTNQSGIGRGYFDWHDYGRVEARLIELLAAGGAAPDMILACGHHTSGVPPYNIDHSWRKPGPGMLLTAQEQLAIDLDRSILAGDRTTDLLAARNAGMRRAVLCETGYGHGETDAARALATPQFRVEIIASLATFEVDG
jgi:D-glycero-D-manno-heptose 1,7-bisphosphate phosphatase